MPVISRILTVMAVLCASGWHEPANSAEFKCVQTMGNLTDEAQKRILALGVGELPSPQTCQVVRISGEIIKGDADRFHQVLLKHQPWVRLVLLISPGGNMAEALTIGRMVRRGLIETWAPIGFPNGNRIMTFSKPPDCQGEHCICASACFFIWVGGISRFGNAIGLHRPYIVPEEARQLSLDQAEEAYKRLVDAVESYLAEMNVPKKYFDQIVRIPSGDIVFLSWKTADSDFGGYIPAIAEWLKSRCGAMTPVEEQDRADLGARQYDSQSDSSVTALNATEEHYYDALIQKSSEINTCEYMELLRERIRNASN